MFHRAGLTKKQTLMNSALISTAGFFFAKLIGLFYIIPFSHILQSTEYMNYYGSAYRLYSYFLSIFTSAIPFAAATMIAKYAAKGDEQTVSKVNRLSMGISAVIGIFCCLTMIILSRWFAPVMASTEEGIQVMQNVLCILSLALLFVPVLAGSRGYVQGRKEMKEYAFSQTFEQICRVGFLLSSAYLLIYMFHTDRVWTLYMAVGSTGIAAVLGLAQIWLYNRKHKPVCKAGFPAKALYKEFSLLAVPYIISAVLGYSDDLYNTLLLPSALKASGLTSAEFDTVMSAVNFVGVKLCSIPMILAPAISSALIGHMAEAFTKEDYGTIRKNIQQCLKLTIYAGSFLTVCIILYIQAAYRIGLFYTDNMSLAVSTVRWCAIEGFMGTLAPIVSTLMMTCNEKKKLLFRMGIAVIIKGMLLYPLVCWLGYPGAVTATIISYGYLILTNLHTLYRKFNLSIRDLLTVLLKSGCAILAMVITSAILNTIYPVLQERIYQTLAATILNGLTSACVFAGLSTLFLKKENKLHAA